MTRSASQGRASIRVSYGWPEIPSQQGYLAGGLVKFQALQDDFPHSPGQQDVLYVVSSRLPPNLIELYDETRRRGGKVLLSMAAAACPATHQERWYRLNEPLRFILPRADHVLFQSRFARRLASARLPAPTGVTEVLYNSVDTEYFKPARQLHGTRPLTVLLGGTQYRQYRLEVGLKTFAQLLQQCPDAQLLVTGRLQWQPDHEAARKWADQLTYELGIEHRVHFLGPYSQLEAPGIYQRADVLMHTMYLDCCPTVVIEAMACGLPVAYGASGGVPELVGEAGVPIPAPEDDEQLHPPDPTALARAVYQAWLHRHELGRIGRRRAVEHFDRAPWVERHKELLPALLAD